MLQYNCGPGCQATLLSVLKSCVETKPSPAATNPWCVRRQILVALRRTGAIYQQRPYISVAEFSVFLWTACCRQGCRMQPWTGAHLLPRVPLVQSSTYGHSRHCRLGSRVAGLHKSARVACRMQHGKGGVDHCGWCKWLPSCHYRPTVDMLTVLILPVQGFMRMYTSRGLLNIRGCCVNCA